MSMLSEFFSAIKSKFGINVKEDAEQEEILAAINSAQSIDDMKAEITAQVTTSVTAAFQTQIDTLNTQLSEITGQMEAQAKELTTVKETNAAQATQLTEAAAQIQALQTENATLKAQNTELSGKMAQKMADWKADGDAAPNVPDGKGSAEAFMQKQKDLQNRYRNKNAGK